MIRILFFVAVILALGLGFAWLADRPGEMILVWQGQRVEMSLIAGIAGFVIALAAVVLLLWLIRAVFSSPDRVQRYFRTRRRDRGYQSLSRGLIAAGAGDANLAKRMTRRTKTLLDADKEPLIHVLEAQTYMIEGRHDDARAKFETMAEKPETRALGLRGLYLEARRLGASEAAQHYADRAVEKAPHLPWAGQAALEFRTKDGAWDDAIRLLDKQRAARIIDKQDADRKRAVLLTARAKSVLEGNPGQAAVDAQEALRLAPTLVPAAVTAAKALFRQNDLRRGSRILEKSWKHSPHPEVGETYVRARAGDSVLDRLKRARKLEALKPNHLESLALVARAALDAHDHGLARQRAEAALRLSPREGLYLLLADIEEADTGDQGRVRHWMAQALRAPRDPAWTADGYVSEQWGPVSPVTGKLDAFVWKVPVEQLSGPELDAEGHSAKDAELAIRTLPPVAGPAAGMGGHGTDGQPPRPVREAAPDRRDVDAKAEVRAEATPDMPAAKADAGDPAPADRPAESTAKAEPASQAPREEAKPSATISAPRPEAPPASSEGGAVIIPLQAPATREERTGQRDRTSAAPSAEPARQADASESRHGGTELVVAGAADEETRGAAASTKAAKREHAENASDRGRTKPDSASDPATIERDREERFLKHRIDDPGVREGRAEPAPDKQSGGSRFRLF